MGLSETDPGRSPEQRISAVKRAIRRLPLIGNALASLYAWVAGKRFVGSASYWEDRYQRGGSSGSGSYGQLALFKAEVLNGLIDRHAIESVIEFGCGDGNQLKLADYPSYLGIDVSRTAIEMCVSDFSDDTSKKFKLSEEYAGETADLVLSLDVIFHLVEDPVFESYMHSLFAAARKLVVIYATDTDEQESPRIAHVRHRRFTGWISANVPGWELQEKIENKFPYDPATGSGSPASFFIYGRAGS
jgi:SAM-dependent methyltransferase